MSDYQFEFEGRRFGLHLPVATTKDGFSPGEHSLESSDGTFRQSNARAFGIDSWTPGEWTWELHTDDAADAATALADMAELERAWKEAARSPFAGDVRELRYEIAGRERVVFGRPSQWTPNVNGLNYGYIEAQAVFRLADLNHYGELRTSSVSMVPATPGGLVSPLVSPLTTLAGGSRAGSLSSQAVGGDTPAPFRATIAAGSSALTNPVLRGEGWRIALGLTLAPGHSVTISTYPWEFGVTREDGAFLNGSLTPDSRLSKARLDHQGETLFFDGIDSSGTATCSVQWRPAYTTL